MGLGWGLIPVGQGRPGAPAATASRKVVRPGSVAAPGRAEQAGDLRYGRVAGFDVAHGGARGLVPGLGHDQLERDLLVAEVGRRGVPELVQFQAVAGGGGGGGVLNRGVPGPCAGRCRGARGGVPGRACGWPGTAARWCATCRRAGAAAGAAGARSRCPSRRTRCRRPWIGWVPAAARGRGLRLDHARRGRRTGVSRRDPAEDVARAADDEGTERGIGRGLHHGEASRSRSNTDGRGTSAESRVRFHTEARSITPTTALTRSRHTARRTSGAARSRPFQSAIGPGLDPGGPTGIRPVPEWDRVRALVWSRPRRAPRTGTRPAWRPRRRTVW